MSYTLDVKSEILFKEMDTNEEHLWEIYAILKGKLAIGQEKIELKLESLDLANRVYKYLKELVNLKISIKYSISKRFGEHRIYIIEIYKQKGYNSFIKRLESLDKISYKNMSDNAITGFVKGLFLATGYLKDHNKEISKIHTIIKNYQKASLKKAKKIAKVRKNEAV